MCLRRNDFRNSRNPMAWRLGRASIISPTPSLGARTDRFRAANQGAIGEHEVETTDKSNLHRGRRGPHGVRRAGTI